MSGVTAEDVELGQTLPELVLDLTPTRIIGTAIASRDYEDVHHDRDLAQAKGTRDIFLNILSTNGFALRLVTDWAGPDALVETAGIRLGVPAYAGDTLTLTGEVAAVEQRDADALVTVAITGRVSIGDHVTGTVGVSVPRRAT